MFCVLFKGGKIQTIGTSKLKYGQILKFFAKLIIYLLSLLSGHSTRSRKEWESGKIQTLFLHLGRLANALVTCWWRRIDRQATSALAGLPRCMKSVWIFPPINKTKNNWCSCYKQEKRRKYFLYIEYFKNGQGQHTKQFGWRSVWLDSNKIL